jgi:hypothetical protein
MTYLHRAPRLESEQGVWRPAWFTVAFVIAASYTGASLIIDAVDASGSWPSTWRAALGSVALATAVAWLIVGLQARRKTRTRRSYR